jgi:hypothetical protein
MTKDSDILAGGFETEGTGGVLSGLLAEEDEFDRRTLWRLGTWAIASVGAVIVAILANQSPIGTRREQTVTADLARHSRQIEAAARETQNEARRLASAVEILNIDRDRLYSRIAVLEQGLDSVTGAISRPNPPLASLQNGGAAVSPPSVGSMAPATNPPVSPAAASSAEAPAASQKLSPSLGPATSAVTAISPVAVERPPIVALGADPGPAPVSSRAPTSPMILSSINAATSLVAPTSIMGPPDPAAGKLIEPSPPSKVTAEPAPEVAASASSTEDAADEEPAETVPKLAVQRTEFGVDVGGANSIPGLRALWRGLLKSRANAPLTTLRPIIVVKEGHNGLGMQLRLVAGPINDAAAAAKICAAMIANNRTCETTVFEGQRLAMIVDDPTPAANAKSAPEAKPAPEGKTVPEAKPSTNKRSASKRASPKEEPAQKPEPSTLSQIFGSR